MAKIKSRRREAKSYVADKIPLVSVVIPMYNSAKFITQTLESLAYQTMRDFEVVVVDDCSTDNSVEVVENFANSVGGGLNLHVIKLPKNTGAPGLPRNVGIQFARGKYIAFLDSDDLFTKTALEELTTLAEEYQAEVVHTNQFFVLWGERDGKTKSVDDPAFTDMNELTNPANFSVSYPSRYRPDKPTLETGDLAERVRKFVADDYTREPYTSFYRRDFLISNQITFPNIRVCEDEPFAFQGMYLAERLLLVPNSYYIIRPREGSTMREKIDSVKEIHKSLRINIDGFNALRKIMDDIKFFNEHPDYRYAVLNWYVSTKLVRLQGLYAQIHPAALNPLVEKEFHPDDAAFAAYLFNTVNIQRLQIMRLQQELAKFHQQ